MVLIAGVVVAWALVALAPPRYRLRLWTVVIIAGVMPWLSFQSHPHWDRTVWVPFTAPPPVSVRDVAVNLALYLPLGMFASRRADGTPRAMGLILLGALVLSICTEASQTYSHGRFPSMTDVVMNLAGAAMGRGLGVLAASGDTIYSGRSGR